MAETLAQVKKGPLNQNKVVVKPSIKTNVVRAGAAVPVKVVKGSVEAKKKSKGWVFWSVVVIIIIGIIIGIYFGFTS